MLPPHETRQLLQAGSAGALADAAAYLRRRVCPDGFADGEDGEFGQTERQWAALLDWAGSNEKILPLGFPGPEREGERATLDELAAAFVAAGFHLLPWRGLGHEGSLSLRCEGFDIWDAHPANVLLSPEGLPLPIDVIITRTPD